MMTIDASNRFLFRKEDWGYLVQDLYNDRIWGVGEEYTIEQILSDYKSPVWLDNPYRYEDKFFMGNMSNVRSLKAPISISWSVTAMCNSKCKFCCTDSFNGLTSNEATIEEISKILDILEEWGVLRVVIGGGEPLLREDIIGIFNLFESRKIKPVLATNGILLNYDLHKPIIDICSNIQISLDSLKRKKYYSIRGIDGLGAVKKIIELLSASKKLVRVVTVLNNENANELDDIAEYLAKTHVKQWFIFDLLKTGRAEMCYEELHYKNIRYIKEKIHQYRYKYPELSVWFWGNQKSDGASVYVMHDGTLHLVDYHNNLSCTYGANELSIEYAKNFWEKINDIYKKDMIENFTCKNRMV